MSEQQCSTSELCGGAVGLVIDGSFRNARRSELIYGGATLERFEDSLPPAQNFNPHDLSDRSKTVLDGMPPDAQAQTGNPPERRFLRKWQALFAASLMAVTAALSGCGSNETSPPDHSPTATPCPSPDALKAPWAPTDKSGTTPGPELSSIDFSTYMVRLDNPNGLQKRLDQLAVAHVKQVRFDTAWNAIEKTPCNYDFAMLDAWMLGLAERHIGALMIAGKVPRWATDVPDCDDEGKCPPRNPDDYGHFAEVLATRYAQFNPDIELGNEIQDIPPQIYAQMCSSAYDKVKQVSPNSLVLFGSIAPADPRNLQDPRRPANYFKNVNAAGGCRWDVMSVHPYTGRMVPGQDDAAHGWGQMIELHDAVGQDNKPFWITEFGTSQIENQVKQLEAALSQRKPWATRLFWFSLNDTGTETTDQFGAVDGRGNARPVYNVITGYNRSHS